MEYGLLRRARVSSDVFAAHLLGMVGNLLSPYLDQQALLLDQRGAKLGVEPKSAALQATISFEGAAPALRGVLVCLVVLLT